MMPKTKKKTKTAKPATYRKIMIFKSLTAFFATTTICLAGFAVFLYFNQKTPLESKKIQAFEPFVLEAIKTTEKLTSDNKSETRAFNIDINDAGNLYIDVAALTLDDEKIPLMMTKGRLIIECDNFDGRKIGIETDQNCKGKTIKGEPKYIETSLRDHIKELDRQYTDYAERFDAEIKAAYGEGHYVEHEDGSWVADFDDFTDEQMDELNEKLAAIKEKYINEFNEFENYEELYEKIWKDYIK